MHSYKEPVEDRRFAMRWVGRLVVLLLVVFACLVASVFLYARWQDARLGEVISAGPAAEDLNPVQLLYLESYLAFNAQALQQPAGSGEASLLFDVSAGESAELIARNLFESGLLADQDLFLRYVRYTGMDNQLETGSYRLNPQMTVPELAGVLTQATIQEVEIAFLDGWRAAEMGDYLEAVRPANIDAREFVEIAEGKITKDLSGYDFLTSLSPGSSLEGYLFPDRYRLPIDADASYLVDQMLSNFDRQAAGVLRRSESSSNLSTHELVILASIIQKETTVYSEMPLMVSVYINRLAEGMLLQADPTVQFALGYDDESASWWKSPLTAADLTVDSPYNTYIHPGLPPGPITNPTLSALQAAAAPQDSEYLYFVADCEADVAGAHIFSYTFDEHLANVNRCR